MSTRANDQRTKREAPSQLAIWVEVTDQHIDVGCPDDCRHCAAAIAIAEALQQRSARSDSRRPPEIWVDDDMVCQPGVAVWPAPPELSAFIAAFDAWHRGRGPRPAPIGCWLPEPDLPGSNAWAAAVKRGLMPTRPDWDPVSRLAWLAAGAEVVDR